MRGVGIALLLLAGCGGGVSADEQSLQDERDIAMVEQTNEMPRPLRLISPEAIGYPDLERYDLFGMACNYAPGTSFGTRVIAREADAYMKIDGEMMRFAADPGARELPMRSRSLYNGRAYSLRLILSEEESAEEKLAEEDAAGGETQSATKKVNYEGSVTLRDRYGRVVYEGVGLAQCGS